MRTWIIGAFVIAMLAGCAGTETQDGAPVEERTPSAMAPAAGAGATTSGAMTPGVGGAAAGAAGRAAGAAAVNPLRDPTNVLSKRSIYFDYDQFAIKDEYRGLIEAHAKYLQANRNARAIVQGNTDERGTREYNIALGQKRADAVKRLMQLLGASEAQIETVSFGKEKPRRDGSDEAAWTENRRADIVHAGE